MTGHPAARPAARRSTMLEIAASATTTTEASTCDPDLADGAPVPDAAARVSGLRRQLPVIDMCDVTFVASTGAAFLISWADAANKRGGATVLRGTGERELFVLELCGALGSFRIASEHRCEPQAS